MAPRSRSALLCVLAAASLSCAVATPGAAAAAAPPSVGPCPTLPGDNVWNTDISSLPVHPRSVAWIASSGGPSQLLHPDWGPSGGSVAYGIPWQVVDGSHQKVPVTFGYPDESDPGPYPLGPDTPIEGGTDRHALVVDSSTCTLYETYDTHYAPGGSTAGSGAVFNLRSNALRPATWTSADAAGLPILPGLVRYGEMRAGAIQHAIRFTVQRTDRSFLWPARHQAGAASDPSLPPMGARFRMRSDVDISGFSADAQVILTAMKRYGLILADNGSNWYFQGDTDPGWSDGVISELKRIPAGNFEAVDESSLMVDPNSGQARAQRIVLSVPPPVATPTPIVLRPNAPPPTPPPPPTPDATPAPSATPVADSIVVDASAPIAASPSPSPRRAPVLTVARRPDPAPVAAVAGAASGAAVVLGGAGWGMTALRRRRRAAGRRRR
jgi:hypothetical protein